MVCVHKFSELRPGRPAAGSRRLAGWLVQNRSRTSQNRNKAAPANNADSGYLGYKGGISFKGTTSLAEFSSRGPERKRVR